MATIEDINSTDDLETTSREKINDNFDALNDNKVEGDLDTDGTLAADSDVKVPSQKAVKTYSDTKVSKTSDQTVADRKAFIGTISFTIIPEIPTTAPTLDAQVCSKKYADDLVIAGGTDADETHKGVAEVATQTETSAGALDDKIVTPKKLAGATCVYAVSKVGLTTHDSSAEGAVNIAHGLGRTPKLVRITVTASLEENEEGTSIGVYDGTTQSSVYRDRYSTTVVIGNSSTKIVTLWSHNGYCIEASIANDATNITLTWAKTGSPTGNANVLWEAIG